MLPFSLLFFVRCRFSSIDMCFSRPTVPVHRSVFPFFQHADLNTGFFLPPFSVNLTLFFRENGHTLTSPFLLIFSPPDQFPRLEYFVALQYVEALKSVHRAILSDQSEGIPPKGPGILWDYPRRGRMETSLSPPPSHQRPGTVSIPVPSSDEWSRLQAHFVLSPEAPPTRSLSGFSRYPSFPFIRSAFFGTSVLEVSLTQPRSS